MSERTKLTPADDLVAAAAEAVLSIEAVAESLDADLRDCDEPRFIGILTWQVGTLRRAAERLREADNELFSDHCERTDYPQGRAAGEPGA